VTAVRALWLRIPVLVRAVLTGLAAAAAGTIPWALLMSANTRYLTAMPWAVPIMAGYLWLYWRYARGDGWPQSTAATRRTNSRANRLPGDLWGLALLAGVLGLMGVLLLQGVLSRLVSLPQQRDLDVSLYPPATALSWVLMSAVVAGVVEETSFRGYMQRPIELRHGPVVAIVMTGIAFGLGHLTHPEITLVLLPYFLAVAAVYGALAHFTDSILPSMVLHAGGNIFSAAALFLGGRAEWQLSSAPQQLVWEGGPDASFWGTVVAFLVVGSAAVCAYSGLSRAAHREVGAPPENRT
jgi:membrane protease YdiL (CAAX protease family)